MDSRKMLSDYIKAKGIKLTFIANKTGMSLDQISKALRKERNLLADEFFSICKALNLPLDYFQNHNEHASTKDVS